MSKLDKFIKDHREEFDTEEPSVELWGKIQEEYTPPVKLQPVKSKFNYWKIAAVFLLLVTSVLLIERWYEKPIEGSASVEKYFTNEFVEAQNFYMQLASEKKAILEKKCKDDPEYKEEFFGELKDLDDQYQQLRGDLKYGNQDEILDAMIVNLQLRIEILNRQLEIIEQINENNKSDENINI